MNEEDLKILKPVIWDYDFNTLDLEKHKKFVIARLMKYGRPEQIKWMLKRYPEEDIIETVKTSRNLDKRTANFWAVHYNIPKDEVKCLNTQPVVPNLPF
jgi:hypothetical protein